MTTQGTFQFGDAATMMLALEQGMEAVWSEDNCEQGCGGDCSRVFTEAAAGLGALAILGLGNQVLGTQS